MWVCVRPGIGRWGPLAAAGSLSASDIPSQTSSAFWLEPENNMKIVDIVNLHLISCVIKIKAHVCCLEIKREDVFIYLEKQNKWFSDYAQSSCAAVSFLSVGTGNSHIVPE